MVESWMGIVIGTLVLVIAATAMVGHYRREHRRDGSRAAPSWGANRVFASVRRGRPRAACDDEYRGERLS
jgi:hypothetical protein